VNGAEMMPGNSIDAGLIANLGWAWLAATIALALHVADEASHDFLAWYNPRALRIRQLLGGFPFPPTFTFLPWLVGLIAGVILLAALTPWAYMGSPWLRPLAYFLAVIHIANGLTHVVGSLLMRRAVPGLLSAPLLLITGGWLWHAAGVSFESAI
jgi:hypothetical protein